MKKTACCVGLWLAVAIAQAAPLRVLLLDFDDRTGMAADSRLGGLVDTGALAGKGPTLLASALLADEDFVLVDRREFVAHMTAPDGVQAQTPLAPSFLHAAQTLRADLVLRGSLMGFSAGQETIDLGGHRTERATVTLRVAVEALDAVDGTVWGVADGAARRHIRQTAAQQTLLGEEDALEMFREAIRSGLPELKRGIERRIAQQASRPRVRFSVATDADPALVELNGMLIGTTPLEDFEVYQGDHVLTVGKPGYREVSKRILFEKDMRIEVPMIRVELDASEIKEVLQKMRMHMVVGEPALLIHTVE